MARHDPGVLVVESRDERVVDWVDIVQRHASSQTRFVSRMSWSDGYLLEVSGDLVGG